MEKELLEDWDLDLEEHRRTADLESRSRRTSPKLVRKLLFSMPPATPPDKVLAREEFGLKHRYAMVVLHTDEPHPHVHVVVKAVSEEGVRLNIQKATLRQWRREFAKHLREHGVGANATERAARGETRLCKLEGIYRATLRGDSRHARARNESVAAELPNGGYSVEAGRRTLVETRRDVERGWRATREMLIAQGHPDLAAHVQRFLAQMPPPQTEREAISATLISSARQPSAPTETIQR